MPSSKDPNPAISATLEQRSEKIRRLVHFVVSVIESCEVPPTAQAAIHEARARAPRMKPAEIAAKRTRLAELEAEVARMRTSTLNAVATQRTVNTALPVPYLRL
jgi:hypothetical protein